MRNRDEILTAGASLTLRTSPSTLRVPVAQFFLQVHEPEEILLDLGLLKLCFCHLQRALVNKLNTVEAYIYMTLCNL